MRHAGGYSYNEDYDLDKCVICGVKMPNENEPTCSLECEEEREARENNMKDDKEHITFIEVSSGVYMVKESNVITLSPNTYFGAEKVITMLNIKDVSIVIEDKDSNVIWEKSCDE